MYAKVEQFEDRQKDLSQIAKLFSHPARLAIMELLAQKQNYIVGDIAQELSFLSRSTVSQHLQELKNMGIIRGEIDGVKICYCLDHEKLEYYKKLWIDFFDSFGHLPQCTNC